MKENARSLTVTIHKFYKTYLYSYFIEMSHFKAVINTKYTLKLWSCFQSTIFSDISSHETQDKHKELEINS